MNQMSIEARLAHDELLKLKAQGHGAICRYDILAAVISCDPQTDPGYGYVKTARRILLTKHDMVLECVPRIGIKYLGPRETINLGVSSLKRIRRAVKRCAQKQSTVVPNELHDLTNEERITHSTVLSTMGILDHITKPTSRKKIEGAVVAAERAIPAAETLALFAPKDSAKKEQVQ